MPLINRPVEYSVQSAEIIAEKKASVEFQHERWSDADLEGVRREIRNHYRNEQRLMCAYCRAPVSSRSAAGAPIEHIVSKSSNLNFMFEPRNLCVVCPDCNEYKSKREVLVEPVTKSKNIYNYPDSSDSFRIVHPHYDDFDDHIMQAHRLYVECSDKGGYTIYVCNLNRFYKKFGRCDEYVEDIALIRKNEQLHERGAFNT